MPLTWDGRIGTVDQMREIFRRGADKITLNTGAFRSPELITEGAKSFGCQAIVVSMDVLRHADGRHEVFVEGGRTATGWDPTQWAREVERRGAGEILLQSVDRDGTGAGYDLDLIRSVVAATSIPVIACSGVGATSTTLKASGPAPPRLRRPTSGTSRSFPTARKACDGKGGRRRPNRKRSGSNGLARR